MNRGLVLVLMLLTLLVFDSSAEAGRRKERRASRKGGGGGIYAGAYQRHSGGGAYPVAKVSYDKPDAPPGAAIGSDVDLTVADIAVEDEAICVTARNIGHVASPETRLEVVTAHRHAPELEAQTVRVLPLLPNQAVKIRFTLAPPPISEVRALVDPDRTLAETAEDNNAFQAILVDARQVSDGHRPGR